MQISNVTKSDEDLLKKAVIQLVNVMATDFGDRFKQAFKDDEQITQLKRRLYGKLKGLHIPDIYDGYEMLVDKKPSYVPTVPEIVESVLYCQKKRLNDEKNQTEAERIGLMPPKQEVSESVARQNLKKIRELLGNAMADIDKPETAQEKTERMERLKLKSASHEGFLKKTFPLYGKSLMAIDHKCHVGWCDKYCTISHAITGNGNWYCAEHFRQNG